MPNDTYIIKAENIQFIADHLATLSAKGPLSAETIAQELVASFIVSTIRNGG